MSKATELSNWAEKTACRFANEEEDNLNAISDLLRQQDEALKMALDCLESCEASDYGRKWVWPDTAHATAMANVKAALAKLKELT